MDALHTRLAAQLEADEARKRCVYRDSLGLWTIGIGRLVDASQPGAGLRDSEIDLMLVNDIDDRIAALTRLLPWFASLDPARQGALLNMSFQLGVPRFMGFVQTLAAVRDQHYDHAAVLALDSVWAKQTPQRAARVTRQLATGEWQ